MPAPNPTVTARRYRCTKCGAITVRRSRGTRLKHCPALRQRGNLDLNLPCNGLVEDVGETRIVADRDELSSRIMELVDRSRDPDDDTVLNQTEIAQKLGCTREYVRQVCKSNGRYPPKLSLHTQLKKQRLSEQESRQYGPAIEIAFKRTRNRRETAELLGVPIAVVDRYLGDRVSPRWENARSGRTEFSDDDVIAALQQCAHDLGIKPGGHLKQPEYANWRDRNTKRMPSGALILSRAKWNEWMERAGFVGLQALRKQYNRIDAETCVAALDRYVTDSLRFGVQPSAARYTEWAKPKGLPCNAIIRRRLGGWTEAIRASLIRVDPEASAEAVSGYRGRIGAPRRNGKFV